MKVVAVSLLWICSLLVVTASSHAQESTNEMPEKARQELDFMVGTWKSQFFVKDNQTGHSIHNRQWTKGKECMLFTSSGESNGAPISATGISGWNAAEKAIVEHWYLSGGGYIHIVYPLSKMTEHEWIGTSRVVYADGTMTEGPVKLVKGNDRWTFTSRWRVDGEELTTRNETHKIEKDQGE